MSKFATLQGSVLNFWNFWNNVRFSRYKIYTSRIARVMLISVISKLLNAPQLTCLFLHTIEEINIHTFVFSKIQLFERLTVIENEFCIWIFLQLCSSFQLSTYRPPPKGSENLEQGLFVPKPIVWQQYYDPLHVLRRAVHRRDFHASMERFTT